MIDYYNDFKTNKLPTHLWSKTSYWSYSSSSIVPSGMVAPSSDLAIATCSAVTLALHYSRTFKLNMNGYGEKGVEGGIWPKMLNDAGGNADRDTLICSRC